MAATICGGFDALPVQHATGSPSGRQARTGVHPGGGTDGQREHRVEPSGLVLTTCQSGFEELAAREMADLLHLAVRGKGPGWLRTEASAAQDDGAWRSAVFPHLTLFDPIEVRGDTVNALANAAIEVFLAGLEGERIDAPWPNFWRGSSASVGLGRRVAAVESAFTQQLRKRYSRVAKLAIADLPRGVGRVRGLFVLFTDFRHLLLGREAFCHGPRRMAADPRAPSRSFLKVEEAYGVLGRKPGPGETVCDLGAAPGGWSYSAARRGARVIAVDNGPLKGGALNHPAIEHLREDAFGFSPGVAKSFDWLFCDLVEEPNRVWRDLVEPWLARGWCRNFIVNLKFGRVDPIALLRQLRVPRGVLTRCVPDARISHLYHDREEFTVVGSLGPRLAESAPRDRSEPA